MKNILNIMVNHMKYYYFKLLNIKQKEPGHFVLVYIFLSIHDKNFSLLLS